MQSVEKPKTLPIIAPATGTVIGEIKETLFHDIPMFYERGKVAFHSWKNSSMDDRLNCLKRLKQLIVDEMDQLARIIADDTGKVLTEALVADIMPVLDAIDHTIKHAPKILGRRKVKTPILLMGKKSYVEYMPRGVILVISPWNYPFQLAMVPMISALAAGNAVILKPSEVTPLVGKTIENLFLRAEFPESTVQVAHGGKEVGAAFVSEKPDYLFFTGSVSTGKIVQRQAALELIPTTLELGGKDPMIVFKDANLKRAAKGAVWGAFTNSGQVCMSTERLFVEKEIFHEFLENLKREIATLRHGIDENHDIGSMTFPKQKEIVCRQLKDALEKGAQLETGKHPNDWKDEMFLPLTVLSNVTKNMEIINEETFGPILPVIPFESEEEAIQFANDSDYGLNASVWTRDRNKARRVASSLISGSVVVNDVIVSVANHGLPFGGTKNSGLGKYHGEAGLRTFCHEKAIMVDRGLKNSEVQWFPYKGKYPLFLSLFQSYFSEKRNWLRFLRHYLSLLRK